MSLRGLIRLLNVDLSLRKLVGGDEKGYTRSDMSRFARRVRKTERLVCVIKKAVNLLGRGEA